MANSYLGRRTRKRDGRKKEGLGGRREREGSKDRGPDRRRRFTELLLSLVWLAWIQWFRLGRGGKESELRKDDGEKRRRKGVMEQNGHRRKAPRGE